jgi:phosphoserine phosphatase
MWTDRILNDEYRYHRAVKDAIQDRAGLRLELIYRVARALNLNTGAEDVTLGHEKPSQHT